MAVEVTIICDRCKDSWIRDSPEAKKEGKQIWTIGMGISHGHNQPITVHQKDKSEWCRKCVIDTGLLDATYREKGKEVKLETRPSFEDRVIELIEELGFRLSND